jgi:hypothetical protein
VSDSGSLFTIALNVSRQPAMRSITFDEDLKKLASDKRAMAQQIRRIAASISLFADRDKLLMQATALEAEGDALERRAGVVEPDKRGDRG